MATAFEDEWWRRMEAKPLIFVMCVQVSKVSFLLQAPKSQVVFHCQHNYEIQSGALLLWFSEMLIVSSNLWCFLQVEYILWKLAGFYLPKMTSEASPSSSGVDPDNPRKEDLELLALLDAQNRFAIDLNVNNFEKFDKSMIGRDVYDVDTWVRLILYMSRGHPLSCYLASRSLKSAPAVPACEDLTT